MNRYLLVAAVKINKRSNMSACTSDDLVVSRLHYQLSVHVHDLRQKQNKRAVTFSENMQTLRTNSNLHFVCDGNLIVEPVLIRQRRQVVQCQSVFLVDNAEGGDGLLHDRCLASGNFWEDAVFPAQAGKPETLTHGSKRTTTES